MIKKLDSQMNCIEISVLGTKKAECLDFEDAKTMGRKINELVDTVNKLETMAKNTNTVLESLVEENNIHEKQIDEPQMKLEPEKCETPIDPYAEQRKWIGKLCKFWDIDNDNLYYGPLTKIHDTSPYCYECNHKMCYANCEPVKDDIIYKGGDNE